MEVKKNKGGFEHVDIKTAHGTIRVHQNAWGKDYPGIAIDFIPDAAGKEYQVAVIEDVNRANEEPNLNVRVWGSPWKEDTTHEMDIALARIEEYFSEEDNDVKCPKCGEIAALGQWNLATEEFYGSGITPLTTEDLTGGDLTEAETCDYVCPYCKAESVGASIIVINKR